MTALDEARIAIVEADWQSHNCDLACFYNKSIVMVSSQAIHFAVLNKPIVPLKKYKFEFQDSEGDCSFAGVGITQKGKMDADFNMIDLQIGYRENLKCIVINSHGQLMHDCKDIDYDCSQQNRTESFFKHNDLLEVSYYVNQQQVSFANMKTGKKLAFPYKIDPKDIEKCFVGVFLGPGKGSFKLI